MATVSPCSSYPVSLPACPDNIAISAGLDAVTIYRYELTSKFGTVYNGLSMTSELGILFIPVATSETLSQYLFTQYSGTFSFRVFKQAENQSFQPAQFVIRDLQWDELEFVFKLYKPSIGAFDPSNPVYVPVDDNELQVVDDIAARNALTLHRNSLVFVRDATGDTEVPEGDALYLYDKINDAYIRITSPTLLTSSLLLD